MEKFKIIIVAGSKGGTGKTEVAKALLDYMDLNNLPAFLVETDTSTFDVGTPYLKNMRPDGTPYVLGKVIDLDHVDGWITLINETDAHPDKHIVINTGARNDKGIADNADLLAESLEPLNRELVTLWVASQLTESLRLCKKYMRTVPFGTLHMILNGRWGKRDIFKIYDNSALKKAVEKQGLTLYFPEVAERVASAMRQQELPIAAAKETFPKGEGFEITRWRKACAKVFDEIMSYEPRPNVDAVMDDGTDDGVTDDDGIDIDGTDDSIGE